MVNHMKKLSGQMLWILFLLEITACSSQKPTVETIPLSAVPSDEIAQLDLEVKRAKEQQVHLLSPKWFSQTERSLSEASKLRTQGEKVESILNAVATGRAELAKARSFANISATAYPRVIKAREDALKVGANRLEKEFAKVEQEFLDLGRAIENNDLRYAENHRERVLHGFRQLELRAIKHNALSKARETIDLAIREGAKDYAPSTLSEAQNALSAAEDFITNNRYSEDAIKAQAEAALFQANRLKHITEEAKSFSKMTPEGKALWVEKQFYSLASAGHLPDLRNESFTSQVGEIEKTIVALGQRGTSLARRSEELGARVSALKGVAEAERRKLMSLEEQQAFQKRFSDVRALFKPEEAEIFKEQDTLIIRLKSIEYPPGQYVLLPKNYPLLTKVGKAVRLFDTPAVKIEGHTDAMGSKKSNDKLSLMRADNVKEYLVANQIIPEENVIAIGLGDSKPIATNKTATGRAINRRIDIIIEPQLAARVGE